MDELDMMYEDMVDWCEEYPEDDYYEDEPSFKDYSSSYKAPLKITSSASGITKGMMGHSFSLFFLTTGFFTFGFLINR